MAVFTSTLVGSVVLVELKAALEKQKIIKVKAICSCFLQKDKCLEFAIGRVLCQNCMVQV